MNYLKDPLEQFVSLIERFGHMTNRKDFALFWKIATERMRDKANPQYSRVARDGWGIVGKVIQIVRKL